MTGIFLLDKLPMRHRWHRWMNWAVLALGMVFSLGGAYLYQLGIRDDARQRFHASTIDKANAIDLRIRAYADVLYALRGLFDASSEVTRDNFHEFARALSLGARYPGLTNISFSVSVPRDGREAFERVVRAETGALVRDLPKFSIKPPGERPEYLVLHYVEPMGKNVVAWGLDLLYDPLRRSAAERARDTGEVASVSGVSLIRDDKSVITSTLLRLAVYRGGGVPESVSERQRLFIGVVGSTLRVGELVEATLMGNTLGRMRVRIFSGGDADARGDAVSAEQLLYDSHPAKGAASAFDDSAYTVNQNLAIGDREWRVAITPLVDPVNPLDQAMVAGVLTASLALTALLFWLIRSLATAQLRGLELAQRSREAALLTSLGEDLHSCHTIKEAYDVVAKKMPEFLPGTAGVLYVLEELHSRAKAAARWGQPGAVAEEFASHGCQSIRSGHPYLVKATAKAVNCGHFTGDPPDCYLCVPLSAQGEVIGMLHVQSQPDALHASMCSDTGLNLIKAAAQHLELALANLELREKLFERATRDNLTSLYNRHYMREWFEQELNRAKRHRRSIGVIMLDIDHFKRINDDFGHEAGDMVLHEMAGVIRSVARISDVACRHGGEEFLLLMPEATVEGTLGKAEELRQKVARLALSYEGQALGNITISAGVAMYPAHATTADTLLRRADEALYAAKEGGRNRVIVSGAQKQGRGRALPSSTK